MNLLFSGVWRRCRSVTLTVMFYISRRSWTATAEAACWSGSALCTYESLECVYAPNNSTDYPSFCELLGGNNSTVSFRLQCFNTLVGKFWSELMLMLVTHLLEPTPY